MTSPKIPHVVTHANMGPLLDALLAEPEFACPMGKAPEDAWYRREVILEVPLGELAKDGLTTLALVGCGRPATAPLTGKEGFSAQGLEGKAVIMKDLFSALMNLRDLVPVHRGRILA